MMQAGPASVSWILLASILKAENPLDFRMYSSNIRCLPLAFTYPDIRAHAHIAGILS
jgi:hypothetical protein